MSLTSTLHDKYSFVLIDDSDWLKDHLSLHGNADLVFLSPSKDDCSADDYFFTSIGSGLSAIETPIFWINVNLKLSYGWRQSQAGIDILKHIRYTTHSSEYPEILRFAPAILYSFESESELLRRNAGGLILHSPGVRFLRLPDGLSNLRCKEFIRDLFTSAGSLSRSDLLPFVVASHPEGGQRVYCHDYRNDLGAAKFITEFAGDLYPLQDPGRACFETLKKRDLLLKELILLHRELDVGNAPNGKDDKWKSFRGRIQNYRFLYIDDEHYRGWSLGLYSGLFGSRLPRKDRPVKEKTRQTIGGLTVVDSYSEAISVIEECYATFDSAIKQWADGKIDLAEEKYLPYHVVFLDLRLDPNTDWDRSDASQYSGIKVLRFVREKFPTIPVILMTASEKAASYWAVVEAGARFYWTKGINSGEALRDMISQALNLDSTSNLEFHERWVKLCKVLAKKEWTYYEWNGIGSQRSPHGLDKANEKRLRAEILLCECFDILLQGREGDQQNTGLIDSGKYRRIFFDLGMIQELRYQKIPASQKEKDAKWKAIRDEYIYRKKRNGVVHRGDPATYEDALGFFDHTLGSLLNK